jgi:intracellular multiplication protein IcmB
MAGIISNIAGSLLDSLGRSVNAFVELETADSKYVLAAKDGSLVTILSVGGVASLVGDSEFSSLVSNPDSDIEV